MHLPLCPGRCPYCDFFAQTYDPRQARLIRAGLAAHLALLPSLAKGRRLATLYLGGGTPSMWPAAFIAGLIQDIAHTLGLEPGAEVSLEANPGTLSPAKLERLARAGINRLSLGVQSMTPALLARLGRRHGPQEVARVVAWAREAGLDNLNLDLIHGLPGQSQAQALSDLEQVLALAPEHVSLYELTLEGDTPFARRYQKGQPPLPAESELEAMEDALYQGLAQAGYGRYEVSNFARPGRACRHNQSTWRGGDYLALGPGACGHLAGRRWGLTRKADAYLEEARAGREPHAYEEKLIPMQRAGELFMLGLRTSRGVDLGQVATVLGDDPREKWRQALAELEEKGWACLQGKFLRPSPRGLAMADAAAALFF